MPLPNMADQWLDASTRHCELEDTSSITNDSKTVNLVVHLDPNEDDRESAPELERQDENQSEDSELKNERDGHVDEPRRLKTQHDEANTVTAQDLASLREDAEEVLLRATERLLGAPERSSLQDFQSTYEHFSTRLIEIIQPKSNHGGVPLIYQLCSVLVLCLGLATWIGLSVYYVMLRKLDQLILCYVFESIESIESSLPGKSTYSRWYIPHSEVDLEPKQFARGRNSSLFRGTWLGASVVIKSVPTDTRKNYRAFLNEVALWRKLQSPHIIRLLGACDDDIRLFVCELASTQTLSKYVYQKSKANVWTKLYETALGLQYLHEKHGVVHGDLICANILIGKDKKAKLTGFGSSFELKRGNLKVADIDIFDWHCAPEVTHKMGGKSFASDVYSLGMCVIEALVNQTQCGYVPYAKKKHEFMTTKNRLVRPDNISNKQWDLVCRMCAWLPSHRPDIFTVVSLLKCIANEESETEDDATFLRSYEVRDDGHKTKYPEWFICEDQVEIATNAFKRGGFGSIHHGTLNLTPVVVKRLLEECSHSMKGMKSFMKEAMVWHKLNHPHVIRLYGACHISNPPFYVCESAVKHGNLDDYLCLYDKELRTIWRIFDQAAKGLLYLHNQGIVHGDLKCNNILVSDNKTAKLSDFGLSIIRMESKTMSKQVQTGAIQWVAPECLSDAVENPTCESDVYSFAMCIIEAFKRSNPWGGTPDLAVMKLVAKGLLPQRPDAISDEGWALVEKMASPDPAARISILEVVDQLNFLAEKQENEECDKIQVCMNCERMYENQSRFCSECGEALQPSHSNT